MILRCALLASLVVYRSGPREEYEEGKETRADGRWPSSCLIMSQARDREGGPVVLGWSCFLLS